MVKKGERNSKNRRKVVENFSTTFLLFLLFRFESEGKIKVKQG